MELTRFLRALRDRWILVVGMGLLGLASAVILSSLAGEAAPVFNATAPIQFQLTADADGSLSTVELEEAQASAATAASSIVAEDPEGRFISIQSISGQLLFSASAPTVERADELAKSMRQAFLDVDPLAGGANVTDRIALIEEEAARLQGQLAALGSNDPTVIAQHDFIDRQVTQHQERLLQLAVLKVTADDETRPIYDREDEQIREALSNLAAEKAALPALIPNDAGVLFRQQAIQRRLDVLGLEFERLYLRQLGVTSGGTSLPVQIIDLSPPPPSLFINGLLGLVVGLALAALAISIDARFRRPVWVADDVSLPVLGELPSRRVHSEPGKVWYDRESRHPRKPAIQALRAAIEGRLPGRSNSIAITGLRTGSSAVQAVAVDLGVSFANAGWSVLIVDAELDTGTTPAELKGLGPTLAQVLNRQIDDPEARRRVAVEAIEKASRLRPNVSVVAAGTESGSAADALSGTNFQLFLEEATARFDLVLMVGDDLATPAGQVLTQRLDYAVVCMVPGRTSADVVEDMVEELGDRGVVFLGATFLHRKGSARRGRAAGRVVTVSPARVGERKPVRPQPVSSRSEGADLEVARLTPGRSAAAPVARGQKKSEGAAGPRKISAVVDDEPATPLQAMMLEALDNVEKESYEQVAGFLVDCVTRLLTAGDDSDFSNDARMAAQTGFVPLHDVKGYESLGSILTSEFRIQLGPKLGSRLATEAAWVLSEGFGATGATFTLDEWLSEEYFPRHLELSGHEPAVWHLASRHGTVQVLVDSARLSRDCIDDLRGSVVQRTIEALERNLKSAVRSGKSEAVERLGEQLTDARTFEIALGWLYEGTTPNARLVYPSMLPHQQPRGWDPIWTEGVKPNIAPLQRLGLLAAPVLTDAELETLRPTG